MTQRAEGRLPHIPSFWTLQLGGWLLYVLAMSAATIPIRQMPGDIAYRGVFLLSGFVASFGMHLLCRAFWRRRTGLFRALLICVVVSYVLGFFISALCLWAEVHASGSNMGFRLAYAFAGATGGCFVLIAWSAFYFGIKHYASLEEQKLRLLASESSAREAQLRALRYQLQPHFLFNTLNAISTLVLDNQPRQATRMISGLAGLLRSTLESPEIHQIPLQEEIAVTEEYLGIEKVRFGPRLSVSFQIAPGVEAAQVPRLLLQPLVENAVRHGVATRPQGGEIVLRADAHDTTLRIRITNDSDPADPRKESRNHRQCEGLGLRNTRARLEQLYGAEATLQTTNQPAGAFTVSIDIPLRFGAVS